MEQKDREHFDLEEDAVQEDEMQEDVAPEEFRPQADGEVRISEEVILQLATQALKNVHGVKPAGAGPLASLGLGRKTTNGIRIAVEEGMPPRILVDAYISVKYGMRIPDVAWDVQESVKGHLETYTGYHVKSVNVYVQNIYLNEAEPESPPSPPVSQGHGGPQADTTPQTPGFVVSGDPHRPEEEPEKDQENS
ncbi:Asp23/Gls24 family envelope stress response protein [Aminiphilus circumscriptus]|uniref:Asp23/Gls24 family envelope stress response protein n=1 Tax=Aminiphilus circumscriptus TaxID=290732 RepID=UPI0004923FA6|nr:Asp23/Gls24 family envelope stress response protein [Aminiphilus circumscriptus]